jgi:predicted RNA-binding Zn-ribbon protein involved in translation (DUF1610 family)
MNHTKEPCPYCDENTIYKTDTSKGVFMLFAVEDRMLKLQVYGNDNSSNHRIKINYCPMCGRKLEDV